MDDYVVRYAPSGGVLRTAQQRLAAWEGAPCHSLRGLFNPMKGDEEAKRDLSEDLELPWLRRTFEAAKITDIATEAGDAASVEQALAWGPEAGYLHLACHGSFSFADPRASGLQLAKSEQLAVDRILRELRLPRCRLVGTMWFAMSGPSTLAMGKMYELHLAEGLPPAHALRAAVQWMRGLTDSEISAHLRAGGQPNRPLGSGPSRKELGVGPRDEPPASGNGHRGIDFDAAQSEMTYDLPVFWAPFTYSGV